jgi:hypothetical protein
MSIFIRSIFPPANIGSSGGSVRRKLFPCLLSAMKTGHGELRTGELHTAIIVRSTTHQRPLLEKMQFKSRDLLLGIEPLLRIRTSYDSHSVSVDIFTYHYHYVSAINWVASVSSVNFTLVIVAFRPRSCCLSSGRFSFVVPLLYLYYYLSVRLRVELLRNSKSPPSDCVGFIFCAPTAFHSTSQLKWWDSFLPQASLASFPSLIRSSESLPSNSLTRRWIFCGPRSQTPLAKCKRFEASTCLGRERC